jgi:RNA polymerase-binding transcription factor DksA
MLPSINGFQPPGTGTSIAFHAYDIKVSCHRHRKEVFTHVSVTDHRSCQPRTGEMQQYSELLLGEKARLQSELCSRLESLHSGRSAVDDQAPVVHEQFVAIRLNNVAHGKIKAIDAALERLKCGEYGICEECGEPISAKRLKALPCGHATASIAKRTSLPITVRQFPDSSERPDFGPLHDSRAVPGEDRSQSRLRITTTYTF